MPPNRGPSSSGPDGLPFGIVIHTAQPRTIADLLLDMYTPWPSDFQSPSGARVLANYIHSNNVNATRLRNFSESRLVPVIFQIVAGLHSGPFNGCMVSDVAALLRTLVKLLKAGIGDTNESRPIHENTRWPHGELAKEQLLVVCDTMWLRRAVFFDATTDSDDVNLHVQHVQEALGELEMLYMMTYENRTEDPRDSRTPPEILKVSLYAWAHGGGMDHHRIVAQNFSSKHRSDDDIRSALQDESDVIAIMRTASTALADEQTLNEHLHNTLIILWTVFQLSEVAHSTSGSSDPDARGIIELILGACQRQACMGDDDPLKREYLFYHITSCAFGALGMAIVGLASAGDTFDGLHLARYKKVMGRKNALPLIGKFVATMVYIPYIDAAYESSLNQTILALSVILEFQAAMVIRRDPALSHADIEKIMLVSSTWYHTLTTWLEVPPSNEREMKAICERTLVIWKRYGDALGLDRVIEKPVVFSTSRQCGWKTCLCYQMDPAHRMKLCKGCFLVYYCSKHCQKNDWKEDHRVECQARAHRT